MPAIAGHVLHNTEGGGGGGGGTIPNGKEGGGKNLFH